MATIAERIAAAEQRKKAAEASVTEADRAEMAERTKLAQIEEEARKAEEETRALSMARRLDAARDRLGVPVAPLMLPESDHSFIVRAPKAPEYKAHMEGLSRIFSAELGAGKAKSSRDEVNLAYAVAVVEDWNGLTDFSGATDNGDKLTKFLRENPALVTEIIAAADPLAKQVREARKS